MSGRVGYWAAAEGVGGEAATGSTMGGHMGGQYGAECACACANMLSFLTISIISFLTTSSSSLLKFARMLQSYFWTGFGQDIGITKATFSKQRGARTQALNKVAQCGSH